MALAGLLAVGCGGDTAVDSTGTEGGTGSSDDPTSSSTGFGDDDDAPGSSGPAESSSGGDESSTGAEEPPGTECTENNVGECPSSSCRDVSCVNGYCMQGEPLPDGTACTYTDDYDYPGFCHVGGCAYDCSNDPEDPNYGWCDDYASACQPVSCVLAQCEDAEPLDGVDADEAWQSAGDCARVHCEAGEAVDVVDPGDVPDDLDPCTIDSCDGTQPMHVQAEAGTPCGDGLVCDDEGACVKGG
jgi:hypothetical protein